MLKEQLTEVECPVCHTMHQVKDLEQWEKCAASPEKKAVAEADKAYKQAMEAYVKAQKSCSASKATYEAMLGNTLLTAHELLDAAVEWDELCEVDNPANPLALAVKEKQAQKDALQQDFAAAQAKAELQSSLQAQLQQLKQNLPQQKQAWDGSLVLQEQATQELAKQKIEVSKVQGMLAGCPLTFEQASTELNAAKAQKDALQRAINEAQAAYNNCVNKIASDKGKLEQAKHSQKLLVGKVQACCVNYEAALAGCAASEADFHNMHEACKDRNQQKLTSKNVSMATKKTRESVERFRSEEASYLHTIASLKQELQGKQRLDTTALVAEMDAINAALKSSKERKETLQTDRDFTKQTLEKVSACYANRKKKLKVHRVIEPLAEAANGAITFNRYVLEDLFCAMLDKANDRLGVLCSGQYELRPIEEGQSKRNKGLGFTVYDCINQSHRESGANSGGEKFEISLSLALGLSDIVQSCSKKASRIESLFIDEGFGTLGKEELEKTKRLLLELSGGSRQIGIISHNPVLEEAIKNQIVVERDKQTRAGTKVSFQLDC